MPPTAAAVITLDDSDSDLELVDLSWLAADKHKVKAEPRVGTKRPREEESGPTPQAQSGTWQNPHAQLDASPDHSTAEPSTAAGQPAVKPEVKPDVKPDVKPRIKPDPYHTPGRQGEEGLPGRSHPRYECAVLPFATEPHHSTCPGCLCFVCGQPAPCTLWGDGERAGDHCNADGSEEWAQQRTEHLRRRGVAGAATGADGADIDDEKPSAEESEAGQPPLDPSDPLGLLQDEEDAEDVEALQAVLEGLESHKTLAEAESPPGSIKVQLHRYQKQALAWCRMREHVAHGVRGGILADEQGLGKTIQMLSLIVSEPPSKQDATTALRQANQAQNAMQMHVLSSTSRAARQSTGGSADSPAGASVGNTPGTSGKKGKPKAVAVRWARCGSGDYDCTCARCNKAREQEIKAAVRDASQRDKARREERVRAKAAADGTGAWVPPSAGVSGAPTEPTWRSPDGGVAKRTLVICPLCVASQWVDEVQTKCPQLSVALYHGPGRQTRLPPALLASYDIVISTYDLVGNEHGQSPMGNLFRVRWHRCILDEAHIVRNKHTNAARAVLGLQANNRWCLSGTPIVNTASDVFSLFAFLRYRPFCDLTWFNMKIANRIQRRRGHRAPTATQRQNGYRELRIAMTAITQRRTKASLIDGRPIIVLPRKTISVVHKPLSVEELDYYTSLEERTQVAFGKFVRAGFHANYANILVLLLRLRQACVHPYLAQSSMGDLAGEDGEQGDEDGVGGTPAAGLDARAKLTLLLKLKAADAGECSICLDVPVGAVITRCGHGPFCRECITQALQTQDPQNAHGTCPHCRQALHPGSLLGAKDLLPPELAQMSCKKERALVDDQPRSGSGAEQEEEPAPVFVSSTKLDAAVQRVLDIQSADAAAPLEPDGQRRVSKTCIFSQFTGALNLLEERLRSADVKFLRLDGSMTLMQRAAVVRDFAQLPQVRVLLCSTRASSLGLNLTCANQVILLDVWWNGASEDQAMDRCHRLGQTRDVEVVKFIMRHPTPGKTTVEQRILTMQEEKREIALAALGEGAVGGSTRLTLNDLRQLFGMEVET